MSAPHTIRRLLGLPARRRRRAPARPSAAYSSLILQLVALVQLTVVGGLAFTGGFLGLAAIRALGWPAAPVVLAGGGALLGAILAGLWFRQKADVREALGRLHA